MKNDDNDHSSSWGVALVGLISTEVKNDDNDHSSSWGVALVGLIILGLFVGTTVVLPKMFPEMVENIEKQNAEQSNDTKSIPHSTNKQHLGHGWITYTQKETNKDVLLHVNHPKTYENICPDTLYIDDFIISLDNPNHNDWKFIALVLLQAAEAKQKPTFYDFTSTIIELNQKLDQEIKRKESRRDA